MKESERNEFPFYPPFQFNFVFFCVCDNVTCIFAPNPCERKKLHICDTIYDQFIHKCFRIDTHTPSQKSKLNPTNIHLRLFLAH